MDLIIADLTNTFSVVQPQVAALRLLAAVVLAGMIGFEREIMTKPAGLRTHMLISLAACRFILVAFELSSLTLFGDAEVRRVDPLRLIEAVTAGVAFPAAGAVFTMKGEVKNLTTGASM